MHVCCSTDHFMVPPLPAYQELFFTNILPFQAVYANMYPSNLRSMVLDGVADPQGWFNGNAAGDPTYIRVRADRAAANALERFLSVCGPAGPEKCAFSDGTREGTVAKWRNVSTVLSDYGGVGGVYTTPVAVFQTIFNLYSSRKMTRYNNPNVLAVTPSMNVLDEFLQVSLMMGQWHHQIFDESLENVFTTWSEENHAMM